MRRNCLIGAVVLALSVAGASGASAQTTGFTDHYFDVGPVIGIGSIGSAGISYGGRAEFGFKQLPNLGNGVLSIGLSVDHYSYNAFAYGFSYTPFSGSVNYHFHLMNAQIDPFVGIGLGDYFVSTPSNCNLCSYNSGVYFIAHGGLRYFMTPNLALYGDVGSGTGALHVGVMFKVKG